MGTHTYFLWTRRSSNALPRNCNAGRVFAATSTPPVDMWTCALMTCGQVDMPVDTWTKAFHDMWAGLWTHRHVDMPVEMWTSGQVHLPVDMSRRWQCIAVKPASVFRGEGWRVRAMARWSHRSHRKWSIRRRRWG